MTHFEFLAVFISIVLALIAYVLTPAIANGQTDLKHFYYRNAPWIFGFSAAFLASVIANTRNVLDTPTLDITNFVRVFAILLMIALAAWKNERFHMAAMALAYLLMAIYIPLAMFAL